MSSDGGVPGGASLCCIPVSWPTGFGELARMLTLAGAARQRWPALRCHFVLNRNLPAAARELVPASFDITWLDTSPTNDDAGVAAALDRCRPDLVLFDNAGSGRQCRYAKRLGARTVFLSTRAQTLGRGFALSWLPWLDEHWRIEPRALAAPLTTARRLRAAVFGIRMRSLESLFVPSDAARGVRLRGALGCADRPYVCFVPGGGGGMVDGRPAASLFAAAAALVARQAEVPCVLLLGPLFSGTAPRSRVSPSATHRMRKRWI